MVMEILGHSLYKLTMDTSHVIPALEKETANRLIPSSRDAAPDSSLTATVCREDKRNAEM